MEKLTASALIVPLLVLSSLVFIEYFYGIYKKIDVYADKKDVLVGISLGIFHIIALVITGFILNPLNKLIYSYRILDFNTINPVIEFLFAFLVAEFAFYWWHRASHRMRFIWAIHVNHHSSEQYNFSIAYRLSPFAPFLRPFFYFYLPFLGIKPEITTLIGGVSLFAAIFTHTKLIGKLGFLEKILVTPSAHRVHHGSNAEYIDKNYGGIIILFDQLFGTYEPEVAEVRYGLTTNVKSYNVFKVIFHEKIDWIKDLMNSKSLSEAYKFTFYGPERIAELKQLNLNNRKIKSSN